MREWVLADPWIQSGSSRDPVGQHFSFLGTIFGQSGSSRDRVGHDRKQPNSLKTAFVHGFVMFLGDFSCFPTGPDVVPKTRKLVPDWIPTGQKVVPKNAKLVPDYVPTGSRLVFVEKHIFPPKKMSTYF